MEEVVVVVVTVFMKFVTLNLEIPKLECGLSTITEKGTRIMGGWITLLYVKLLEECLAFHGLLY